MTLKTTGHTRSSQCATSFLEHLLLGAPSSGLSGPGWSGASHGLCCGWVTSAQAPEEPGKGRKNAGLTAQSANLT